MNWANSVIAAAILAAAPAFSAESTPPTAGDHLREIPTVGACENGEERDPSGACPAIDDSAPQRGFTLFSGAMAKPPAPSVPNSVGQAANGPLRPALRPEGQLQAGLRGTHRRQ